MLEPTDDEIRTRAFEKWADAGKPDGEMDRFWHAAKEELLLQRGEGPPPDVLPG